MTTQHTPTPFETSFNGTDWDICARGGGDMIADLAGCDNAEANAAFIVKACNAHDGLVAALRDLLRVDCDSEAGIYRPDRADVQQRARAVLAKVQP